VEKECFEERKIVVSVVSVVSDGRRVSSRVSRR
jgi:hypothetical protein